MQNDKSHFNFITKEIFSVLLRCSAYLQPKFLQRHAKQLTVLKGLHAEVALAGVEVEADACPGSACRSRLKGNQGGGGTKITKIIVITKYVFVCLRICVYVCACVYAWMFMYMRNYICVSQRRPGVALKQTHQLCRFAAWLKPVRPILPWGTPTWHVGHIPAKNSVIVYKHIQCLMP